MSRKKEIIEYEKLSCTSFVRFYGRKVKDPGEKKYEEGQKWECYENLEKKIE